MDETYLPVVTGVAVVGDRVLRLLFSDGTAGDVDFSAEHWTGALAPLNDPIYFAQVTRSAQTTGRISRAGGQKSLPGNDAARNQLRRFPAFRAYRFLMAAAVGLTAAGWYARRLRTLEPRPNRG